MGLTAVLFRRGAFIAPSLPRLSLRRAPSVCSRPAMTMAPASRTAITGPAWDLSDEYAGVQAPDLAADLAAAEGLIARVAENAARVEPALGGAAEMGVEDVRSQGLLAVLAEIAADGEKAAVLLRNVGTYASCVGSVDGGDAAAKKLEARMSEVYARYSQARAPAQLFLNLCSEDVAEEYLRETPETAHEGFVVRHARKMRDHTLSLPEENMLTSYGVPGITAWGALYTDLSAELKVALPDGDGVKTVGVAAAAGMLDSPDESVRRVAWMGIKNAWLPHTETCAAILNAQVAWRLETYRRRGVDDFLAVPLHQNKMGGKSLNAMMAAIDANLAVGRRALQVQAAVLGKDVLEPWDLLAPAPADGGGEVYSFDEGIEIIANAVGEIDAKAADFVRMMRDNKWIEATRGDAKRPGAYCTGFAKSRNPRVYLSEYNGRAPLVLTLAHELGHAYHSWVMRDLPLAETSYPMNLAETASIFFETVVARDLMNRAKSASEKFSIAWNNGESAAVFLLNIPARFKFEKDLYTRRSSGKLSKGEVDGLMVDAWKTYYGEALGRLDEVGIFSASKLHFYISGLSFYNWPYSFGQLFSLSVYAARERLGEEAFSKMYVDLLRDTGRMTAEEVVEKHIGGKIYEKEFWEGGVALVREQVEELEAIAQELGYNI